MTALNEDPRTSGWVPLNLKPGVAVVIGKGI